MPAAIPDIAMLQKAGRRPPKKKRKRNKEFELCGRWLQIRCTREEEKVINR
jgi:hypothetical protein